MVSAPRWKIFSTPTISTNRPFDDEFSLMARLGGRDHETGRFYSIMCRIRWPSGIAPQADSCLHNESPVVFQLQTSGSAGARFAAGGAGGRGGVRRRRNVHGRSSFTGVPY